jgi:WD40 repeat protein
MVKRAKSEPVAGKVVAPGGKVVVVGNLHGDVHIHSEPAPPITPIDPFATVPVLPPSFMRRHQVTKPIIKALLSKGKNAVCLTAVNGMGGVGKSIIAAGICHHRCIRLAFPDGIIWLTIGKHSGQLSGDLIQKMAQHLNQKFAVYDPAAYRTLLKNKAVLVVLDDVWSLEDVLPFRIDSSQSPNSRLLYTSRDQAIAGSIGAENQSVDVLKGEEPRRFLSRRSGRNPMPEPYTSQILDECKGLVLGLAMIGGALQGKQDSEWSRICELLQKGKLGAVGVRVGDYSHDNLYACIAASVNSLDPPDRDRYLRLAVLLEDMPAQWELLQALWGGEKSDIEGTMQLFVNRSLAGRETESSIRLHDFQLDFIRNEHPDPMALRIQHSALMRSLHVIRQHPEQFASQMTGRLLAYNSEPGIATFLTDLEDFAGRPRLWPLWSRLELAGNATVRVLEGHTGSVQAVAISASGERAVSGSWGDKMVRVWNLKDNQSPRVLEGHTGWVVAVAISANGERAVSGSRDNTVRVWDLSGNLPPRVLRGHTHSVEAVAISADGERAVSGSWDNTLRVWDLTGNQPPRVLRGHTSGILAVAISANGDRAVSGANDSTVRVWNLNGSQPPRVLEGHTNSVGAIAISANGDCAVSGSNDWTLRVWDLIGNQPPRVVDGPPGGRFGEVHAVAISANGDRIIFAGSPYHHVVHLWDLRDNQPSRVLEGHSHEVNAVAISANGERAISGSGDGEVRIWDLKGSQPLRALERNTHPVSAVAISANGKRAVYPSKDGTARVWDLSGIQLPRVLERPPKGIEAVALSENGDRVIFANIMDSSVRVRDLNGNRPLRVLEGHTDPVNAVAISANGRRAISSSRVVIFETRRDPDDNSVRVWDLDGNRPPRILAGHTGGILSVAISANGERAVSGSMDNTVRVWDLKSSQLLHVLEGHTRPVQAVAISANGERAVSGSGRFPFDTDNSPDDNSVRVWDLDGNQPPRVLEGHIGLIEAIAISANGERAVSASRDKTLRVWDLENGKCMAVFTCDAWVISCAWAAGRVLAGDWGGQVHMFLWEE